LSIALVTDQAGLLPQAVALLAGNLLEAVALGTGLLAGSSAGEAGFELGTLAERTLGVGALVKGSLLIE
jgi:hypothetical protein